MNRWSRFFGKKAFRRPLFSGRRARPQLELLEDRCLLSTFTVSNTLDSGAGSLRQAIADANTNAGAGDIIEFNIPVNNAGFITPAGASCDANSDDAPDSSPCWWRITLLSALPTIVDSGTEIRGFTQTTRRGDTNPGQVGTGGTVGVDALPLPKYDRPEIAIDGNGVNIAFSIADNGLTPTQQVVLEGVSIYNTTARAVSSFATGGTFSAGGAGTSLLVTRNFVGTFPDGSDPGSLRNLGFGVRIEDGAVGRVLENYVAHNGETGIDSAAPLSALDTTISQMDAERNEAFDNGWLISSQDGIDLNGKNSFAIGNLSYMNTRTVNLAGCAAGNTAQCPNNTGGGAGIEVGSTANPNDSNNEVRNNTVHHNLGAGISARAGSSGNKVDRNVSYANAVGISVAKEAAGGSNSNTFSQNSIFQNLGIGIDLNGAATCPAISTMLAQCRDFDGPTPNDAGDVDDNSNDLANYPVITGATISGGTLFVVGIAEPGSLIQFFVADNPNDPSGLGEGETFIGSGTEGSVGDGDAGVGTYGPTVPCANIGNSCTVTTGGTITAQRFSFAISPLPPGAVAGAIITSTATVAQPAGSPNAGDVSTSEFGPALKSAGPAIDIEKTPDSQTLPSGGTANFTIIVTNTGDVTLTGVVVTDALAPNCAAMLGTLAVGASASYACSLANVTADFTNSATATGTPPLGPNVSDTDTALVDVIHPEIDIVKSPASQQILSGGTATFTITVTNTGDVTLTGVVVADALAPNCVASLGTLAAGASASYICSLANVTADFTNSATATGTPPVGPNVSDTDTALVDVIHPAIDIVKSPPSQQIPNGGTATFTITVTNIGDVTLTNVQVTDALAPNCNASLGTLAAAASTSYTCSLANVTASFTNSATVTGTPPLGPNVTDTATATVQVPPPGQDMCIPNGTGGFRVVGTLFTTVLVNGDVNVKYVETLDINDNSYGANVVNWPRAHNLKDLTGSDKAQFRFTNNLNQTVMDFSLDYITASNTVPSGYVTLGVSGGDGSIVTGSASNIALFKTSLSNNFNGAGFGVVNGVASNGFNLGANSPQTISSTSYAVVNPFFNAWEFAITYEVTVKAAAFGASGFKSVTIPSVHNSPPKFGSNAVSPTPCPAPTTKIGDRVWEDIDKDGVQDTGEPGVASVTVRLQDTGGNTLATTTTNASGIYTFDNLTPGSYKVMFVLPSGTTFTLQDVGGNTAASDQVDSDADPATGVTQVVSLATGQANLTLDAGVVHSGTALCTPDGAGGSAFAGFVTSSVLANGDVSVRFVESLGLNDNSYGANIVNWPVSHTLSSLTGSDKAQFRFYNGAGQKVMDFAIDYITASNTVPSGYKSLGVSGGDGSITTGSASSILSFNTSLNNNFNNIGLGVTNGIASNGFNLTTNSPATASNASYAVINPFFANWEFQIIYEVTVKAAAFGATGFGGVTIPTVHNSPPKFASNAATPKPCGLAVGSLTFSGTTVNVSLTNLGSTPIDIDKIAVNWPTSNGNLLSVKLGSDTIFNTSSPAPSKVITSFIGTVAQRTLAAGQAKTLTFTFQNTASTSTTGYSILIDFGDGLIAALP